MSGRRHVLRSACFVVGGALIVASILLGVAIAGRSRDSESSPISWWIGAAPGALALIVVFAWDLREVWNDQERAPITVAGLVRVLAITVLAPAVGLATLLGSDRDADTLPAAVGVVMVAFGAASWVFVVRQLRKPLRRGATSWIRW